MTKWTVWVDQFLGDWDEVSVTSVALAATSALAAFTAELVAKIQGPEK